MISRVYLFQISLSPAVGFWNPLITKSILLDERIASLKGAEILNATSPHYSWKFTITVMIPAEAYNCNDNGDIITKQWLSMVPLCSSYCQSSPASEIWVRGMQWAVALPSQSNSSSFAIPQENQKYEVIIKIFLYLPIRRTHSLIRARRRRERRERRRGRRRRRRWRGRGRKKEEGRKKKSRKQRSLPCLL